MQKKSLNGPHHFMSNGVSVARFRQMERQLESALRENAQLKQIIRKDAILRKQLQAIKATITHH